MAQFLDSKMESFLLRSRTGGQAFSSPVSWLALLTLPGAALLKYFSGPHNPFDLFALALVVCCIIYRQYGYFALLLAVTLDILVKALEIARLGRPELWPKFLLDTCLLGLEWFVVCSFVIITLEKWATLRAIKIRTDDDLALAKSFQCSLSRKSCHLQRITLHGSINQCATVGGDFYYFRPFGKKMLNFCVGDVMGKGISASLLMAMVMSFVYEWGKQSCNPADIASRLNRRLSHLWDGRRGWFITILYGILDEETGQLQYCAAGQKGGFLLRNGVLSEFAEEVDPPLGAMDPYEFTAHTLMLEPQDRILLFTDGVYEARSPDGTLFGTERLGQRFAYWSARLEDDQLLDQLEREVLEHTGGVYTDDTTLLYLHYR